MSPDPAPPPAPPPLVSYEDELSDGPPADSAPIALPQDASVLPPVVAQHPPAIPFTPTAFAAQSVPTFQVSPARPPTVRSATDAATPGDHARDREATDERRARRRRSMEAFNEEDWPPLAAARPSSQNQHGSSKQLTIFPGASSFSLFQQPTSYADTPTTVPPGPASGQQAIARPRPPPPPVFSAPPAPRPPRRAARITVPQSAPRAQPGHHVTVGDVFAVKQEEVDVPLSTIPGSQPYLTIQDSPPPSRRPPPTTVTGAHDGHFPPTDGHAQDALPGPTSRPFQREQAPSPREGWAADKQSRPARPEHGDWPMAVDDDALEGDPFSFVEPPPAQPRPALSDTENDDLFSVAPSHDGDEQADDKELHPAFSERTVHIASNSDNAMIDGLEFNGHLQHMLPSQFYAWDQYQGNKAVFICDDLDGLDPDSMNHVAAIKKLVKVFQGAWPGSSPKVSRAEPDPNSAHRVRKNTFLLKNIDDDQLAAFLHRRHYIIGPAKITTFPFKLLVSPFFGTVIDSFLEAPQIRTAIVQRWSTEPGLIAIFDKHFKNRAPTTHIRKLFFKSLRIVPMVTKANGELVTEFNIYADAHYLSPPLHKELRDFVKTIRIVDGFAGTVTLRDPDWKCTACPSRGHPRGLCKTHDVDGWHPPAPPQQSAPAPPSQRAPPSMRGANPGRGGRGGRGMARGRGI